MQASLSDQDSAVSSSKSTKAVATGSQPAGRAIVIGASSGMGAAIVRQLHAEGWRVAGLARRANKLEELAGEVAQASLGSTDESKGCLLTRTHDAAQTEEVSGLFAELVEKLGGLDLIVYAAGIMPEIGPREYSTQKDLDLIQVNLAGCVAWFNQAAPFFESQRSGQVVGISSVAGDRGRVGNPVYCTTKAAMNTYLEALRNRLADFGVTVTTIKPGFVDTAMTQGMDGLFWLISPETAAKQILSAARWGASERYVPRRWWFIMTIIKSIPSFVFKRLNV